MQRILLMSVFAIALVSLAKAQGTVDKKVEAGDEEKRSAVLKVEDEVNQALLHGDAAALSRIYADDLAYTNERGEILDKSQVLAGLQTGNIKLPTMDHDDIRLHVYGNTVVLTGRSNSTLQYKGRISKGPRRFTNVYVKLDGQWRLVCHQVTNAAEQ